MCNGAIFYLLCAHKNMKGFNEQLIEIWFGRVKEKNETAI
jgi:hypothetical protein